MNNSNEAGLRYLESTEIIQTTGGFVDPISAGIAAGVVISALNNWADIKSGAADAYNDMSRALQNQ